MMITIRRATPDDAAMLAELRWEFRSDRPDVNEPRAAFVARCTEWMRAELAGPTWRVWVAIQHGRIVGNVWLGAIPKIPNPGAEREEHAYVSNVYVTPSARGGAGRALLDAALADASARADRVLLWPSALSKTLYARYGFDPHGDLMELKCR
jgi:ribosomal protein S18 acetylase RimI-like enzyme